MANRLVETKWLSTMEEEEVGVHRRWLPPARKRTSTAKRNADGYVPRHGGAQTFGRDLVLWRIGRLNRPHHGHHGPTCLTRLDPARRQHDLLFPFLFFRVCFLSGDVS
jgi:hypothetical protein